MPVAWDEFESVGTNWDDFEPASPRYSDEIIADLPERERRRLDLLSERAAIEADPEVRQAKRSEDFFKFVDTPLIYPEDILAKPEDEALATPTTRGVTRGIAETVSGLTTPQNLALLALGPAGKIAGKAAAGLFGYEMAKTQPELAAAAGAASVEGTEEERALANTRLGINTVLGGLTLAAPFAGVRTRNQIARETLARELENAPLEVPSPDLVARNLAEPGTFRPQEQYGVPRIEAPVEMFEAGEVPFQAMRRFGSQPLPPVEILPQSGRLAPVEILEETRPIVQRETRGKVSFGAEAPTLLRTAVEKAEQVGLTKSAEAARKGANAETIRSDQGQVREQGRQPERVQDEGGENLQQPAPQPAQPVGAQGGAESQVPLEKPRLVAAIKAPSGRIYTGERHPFALASAMDQIRETGGTKAGEMAAELADAQQGFVDVQTGEFLTRSEAAKKMGATGELTSEMIPEAELKANVAELQKRQPLQELRDLPADAGTAKAMELGAKVPKELIPDLEALAKTAADEANRVIAEVDAMPNPTNADLARMSETANRSQLLNEAVEGAKGGQPAILAREKIPLESKAETASSGSVYTKPHGYGTKYIKDFGVGAAMERIEHLRKRQEEVGAGKQAINLAEESDNIGRAILSEHPTYDWVSNTIKPAAASPDIISKLEGMKFQNINEGKVFSLPHPDAIKAIGKQIWNDSIDLAIGAVKAGRTIADAIEIAVRHMRKSGKKFDEAQIRDNLQYTVSNEVVPDTTGESVKMRKSAERATTAPNIPKPVREEIKTAPESLYKQQSMERVEEAVGTMTEGELAAVPKDSDLYTAARLEQANRLFKAGKNDAGYNVFVELEKEGTRLGQLINQFKLLKGSRPENIVAIINSKLRSAGRDVLTKEQSTQAVKLAGDSKAADAALEKATSDWQKSPTAENATKAEAALDAANASAVELQKFVGKFDPRSLSAILKSVLQGNLLTPISQGANLIGNINFQPARAGTRGVAAGLDVIDAAIRNRPREITVQPLAGTVEALKGAGRGLKKAPDVLARGTGETIKGETRAGLHPLRAWVNQFSKNPSMPTTKGRLTLKDRLGLAIEGTMGVPAEGMLRLLGAVDLPFKEAARARVTAEQLRLAKVPREQWSFAQKFPELFLDKKARDIIQDETNRAVFQGESKTLNLFTNWAKSKGGVLDLLVATIAPYKLTPWNIIREILSYNPVIAMGRSVYEGAKGNSRSAKLNAGKFVTGSLLTAVGTWLYNKGLIAPSLDERDEAQKGRILSGKVLPPNHINISGLKRAMSGGDPAFKAGDETVDMFRGGGLAGSIFYMIANVGRAMERGEEVPQGELWMSILRQSTLEQARFGMNQSFLSGVEGLLTAVKDGNTDTFLRQWLNTVGSIPLPNSLNTISRASREYKPDFSADTFNKQVGNMIRGKLGFAGLDDYLPLKRDFWGKPMRETPEGRNAIFYHFFDISKNQQVTSDPVELELYRLWRKSGDSRVIPSIPLKQLTVRNTVYPLNPQQYEKFAELVGTRRREIVDSVAINPEFHKLSDEDKLKFLERIYLRGMEAAKAEFLIDNQEQLEAKPARAGFR